MSDHCRSLAGTCFPPRWALTVAAAGLLVPACAVGAGAGGTLGAPRSPVASPARPQAPRGQPERTRAEPLAGVTVGVDPGHNGGNFTDPSYIGHLIWNGREWETCNTTGTQTASGYAEARFTFRVAVFLRRDLRRDGARVVMTRASNHGVGPCVNRRAEIINRSHAAVAIDIHADGGPPLGRGFAVLEPVADGPNDKVIAASLRFGREVRAAMLAGTTMPVSTYDGTSGITHRDDLAGLNLTSVPEVLIECGNMKNTDDAALLVSVGFQHQVAGALEAAIIGFLKR